MAGNWSLAANWSTGTVPDNDPIDTFAVTVDGSPGQNTIVSVDQDAVIDSLSVDAGDAVVVASGNTLTITESMSGAGSLQTSPGAVLRSLHALLDIDITNDGTLDFTFAGAVGGFADALIDGVGTITGDGALNAVDVGSILTFGGHQTGDGNLLSTWGPTGDFGGTVAIEGTLEGINGSLFVFNSDVTSVAGGTIVTDATSEVIAAGGLLNNVTHQGAGELRSYRGSVAEVTNDSGTLTLSDTSIDGRITNDATLNFEDFMGGGFTNGRIDGVGTITGAGTLYAADLGSVLTFGGHQTADASALSTWGPTADFGGTVALEGTLEAVNGSVYTFNSNVTSVAGGTIITDATSQVVAAGGLVNNVTHQGPGVLETFLASVAEVTNDSGLLALGYSSIDGRITNNGTLEFSGVGGFGSGLVDGVGTITGDGALNAADFGSVLTFGGHQTGDGNLLSTWGPTGDFGGTVAIEGTLEGINGSLFVFNSDVTSVAGGTIVTDATSEVVVAGGLLNNVTHQGAGELGAFGASLAEVTNDSGTLTLSDSSIDGRITNDATLNFEDFMGGGFTNGRIDGVGTITGDGTLLAADLGSVLTFGGHQTGDGSALGTWGPTADFGGTVALEGTLEAVNGSLFAFNSHVTSAAGGTIVTDATSQVIAAGGLLDNVTHQGAGMLTSYIGTVQDVTNLSGTLVIQDSAIAGHITNAGTLRIEPGAGSTDTTAVFGAGTELTLADGFVDGSLFFEDGGMLDGGGVINGNVNITAGGLYANDLLTTSLEVYGDFLLDGLLQMEIAGASALLGQYDRFFVLDDPTTSILEGNAILGGAIEVSFLGFDPFAGSVFDLFVATDISDNGFAFDVFGLDPVLGLSYTTEIASLGSSDVLRLRFDSVNVPEPGTLVLLATGMLGLLSRKIVLRRSAGRPRSAG